MARFPCSFMLYDDRVEAVAVAKYCHRDANSLVAIFRLAGMSTFSPALPAPRLYSRRSNPRSAAYDSACAQCRLS